MLLIYSLGPPSTDCPNSPCCKSSCGRPQRTAKRPFLPKIRRVTTQPNSSPRWAASGFPHALPSCLPPDLRQPMVATIFCGDSPAGLHDRIHNRKGRIPSADLSRASGSPGAHGRKHLRGPRSTAAWQASARSAGAARGPRPRRRDIEMSRSEVHPPNTQRAAGPSSAAVLPPRPRRGPRALAACAQRPEPPVGTSSGARLGCHDLRGSSVRTPSPPTPPSPAVTGQLTAAGAPGTASQRPAVVT